MNPHRARACHVALVAVVVVAALSAMAPSRALAVERTFGASGQLDYFFVPTEKGASARAIGFDGFTPEIAAKVAADLSEHLSANVKVCYGCHGLEVDMAHLDYRVRDELSFRAGRFSPSFGAYNLRHDPANHGLSDKPLPYDMGRMLRMRSWNFGVLPSPFPDQGVEVSGTHWFGESAQLDYAAYAVSGFRAASPAMDLDFVQSRTPGVYYVDNNSRPTVGGRTALTLKLAPDSDLTFGASGMYGTFDPTNSLSYAIVGADVSLRIGQTNVRAEYLLRRQDFDVGDPTRFKYALAAQRSDFFVKHGAYVELEQPLGPRVTLLGRVDGLFRVGNVEAGSELSQRSSVGRATLGSIFTIERSLRLKASVEGYDFSDGDANGRHVAVGFHVASVWTF